MKTITEWNQDIENIKSKIDKEYPDLSKYIKDMADDEAITTVDENDINVAHLEAYYKKLQAMIGNYGKSQTVIDTTNGAIGEEGLTGYPHYPASEDIYNQAEKKTEVNPSDLSKKKTLNEPDDSNNEKGFAEDHAGGDLDVPGAELDDQDEGVGSEDEENNYYSLGGDNHNDLEEDKN